MKVVSVVGARPQFVKLAPVAVEAQIRAIEHVVIHTGQHYDTNMSESFFSELQIPPPRVNLGIGSGSHGAQTGAMIAALEPVLQDLQPDWVLIYGDTNSTLAAAICATKLHLPLAHLEAGLRSFNRRMPEEHNRVMSDHAADLCLAPTENAMRHLQDEGLGQRSRLVGDVMTDVAFATFSKVATRPVETPLPRDQPFILSTIHRPDNTDYKPRLERILSALASLELPVYLPMHPRLVSSCHKWGVDVHDLGLKAVEPLTYPQLIQGLRDAKAVVTDSGGLQKEAYLFGVPTTTVRPETEWIETLRDNWNVLTPDPEAIPGAVGRPRPTSSRGAPYGRGDSAARVLDELMSANASA